MTHDLTHNGGMSETEIPAAIAEQEEHIKRVTSCMGRVGAAHSFRQHGRPGAEPFMACVVCGVTETPDDYAKRIGVSS